MYRRLKPRIGSPPRLLIRFARTFHISYPALCNSHNAHLTLSPQVLFFCPLTLSLHLFGSQSGTIEFLGWSISVTGVTPIPFTPGARSQHIPDHSPANRSPPAESGPSCLVSCRSPSMWRLHPGKHGFGPHHLEGPPVWPLPPRPERCWKGVAHHSGH